jgi:hypothetical protein
MTVVADEGTVGDVVRVAMVAARSVESVDRRNGTANAEESVVANVTLKALRDVAMTDGEKRGAERDLGEAVGMKLRQALVRRVPPAKVVDVAA